MIAPSLHLAGVLPAPVHCAAGTACAAAQHASGQVGTVIFAVAAVALGWLLMRRRYYLHLGASGDRQLSIIGRERPTGLCVACERDVYEIEGHLEHVLSLGELRRARRAPELAACCIDGAPHRLSRMGAASGNA